MLNKLQQSLRCLGKHISNVALPLNTFFCILLTLMLISCSNFEKQTYLTLEDNSPSQKVDLSSTVILVTAYDSYEELRNSEEAPLTGFNSDLCGYAVTFPICHIHYVHNDWQTFIHEYKHCLYGDWHDNNYRISDYYKDKKCVDY